MSSTKDTTSAPKKAPAGPSYEEMIKAAILAHPEDSRTGLSRPLLKKWIHAKYAHTAELSDATFSSRLSRAIASGETKNVFVLPKGPSGKVKLAPGAKPKPVKSAKPAKDDAKSKDAPKKTSSKKTAPKKAAPKKAAAKKDAPKKAAAKKAATPKKASANKAAAAAKA